MKNINQDEISEIRYIENFIEFTGKDMKKIKEQNGVIRDRILAEKMKAYNAKIN